MKYAMSDVGIYTLKKQKELADTYKYKQLPYQLALNWDKRNKWLKNIVHNTVFNHLLRIA